jgi:hypothetical protein
MALREEHRRLADAAMQVHAYKLYGKRLRIPKDVLNASYQATMQDDMRERPNSPKGWYTATAKSVNNVIVNESKKAVKTVFKEYKVSALDSALGLGAASAVAFAPAAANVQATQPIEVSRRAMLAMGAAAAGVAMFAPSQAAADNKSYISGVRSEILAYSRSNAPNAIRNAGAAIRG